MTEIKNPFCCKATGILSWPPDGPTYWWQHQQASITFNTMFLMSALFAYLLCHADSTTETDRDKVSLSYSWQKE